MQLIAMLRSDLVKALLLSYCLLWTHTELGANNIEAIFGITQGSLCINSDYILTYDNAPQVVSCADLCLSNQRCIAFSLDNGPCQLYVFDKCSKLVRDCGCSKRGRVFIRKQPGLQLGELCPPGYGYELCGVKYKINTGLFNWTVGLEKCNADSGLVIVADATDVAEMQHLNALYSTFNIGSFFLGGAQAPGSPEPYGGYTWIACNITVNSTFWSPGDNPNYLNAESVIGMLDTRGLADFSQLDEHMRGALCECLRRSTDFRAF